ncbi:MAG: long-chain fatty acid--CoA ligase [Pseudomonadota bacterium]|nr:long-chain fatty acid--CoA ligase [Pseudomonadota bacterium]
MTVHPWLKSYAPGVSWDTKLETYPVWRILDDAVKRWPDKAATDFMGKELTYRDLDRLVAKAAKGFQKLGVKPGVHVGLFLPNTPHYVISFFGILKAGGTVVNYSPLDAIKVLEHKIEDSQTDIMVTLDLQALFPQAERMLKETRLKKLVVGGLPDVLPFPKNLLFPLVKSKDIAKVPKDDAHVRFKTLLDNDGKFTPVQIGDPADTLAVLQYTGGTTGLPKGAMLTHGNLTAATSSYAAANTGESPVLLEGKERILAVLPLFHIYALQINMLLAMRFGATIILHPRFELEAVLKDLEAKKPTMFPGVPTMFTAIVNAPGVDKLDLSSLRYCASGGAPLPVEIAQRFEKLTGCKLNEGWGMTETSPAGVSTPATGAAKPGSCGIPMPGIEIKFIDVDDPSKTLPMGERGEICIRGANVMKGYWQKPEATKEAFTEDGFFRTGDVGYMDDDGYMFIVDRTKDMILCGGFNVYPRNIEEAVYQHPSVAEVSVIGIPDDYRGQAPKAFIKLKPGAASFTLDEMKAFLRDKIGKHEMISDMDIRDELPKTLVGKLSKKELYEEEEKKRAMR